MKTSRIFYWIVAAWLLLLLAACGSDSEPEIGVTLVVPTSIGSGGGNTAVPSQPETTATPVNLAPTVTVPGDEAGADGGGEEGEENGEATPGAPTPTLKPSPTPDTPPTLPATNPAATVVTSLPLPGLSRDLLFVGDGALQRWQGNGQVAVLLPGGSGERNPGRIYRTGDVAEFSVTENGRFLVAARVTATDPVSEAVPHTFEFILLNLDSRETRVLVPAVTGVQEVALAGNGEHLAYIAQPESAADAPAQVQIVQTGSGSTRTTAACANPCRGLAWHPDNKNVAWGDGTSGIWLYNTDGTEAQLLLPHAGTGEDAARYAPISWAGNGRFLLIRRSQGEGGEHVVFDVPTGQIIPLPGSFAGPGQQQTEVTWMQDHRLLVSQPANPESITEPPLLQIWRVNVENGQLVQEVTDAMPVAPSGITAPIHLENGRFGFLLYHPNNSDVSGLYILKGFGDILTRVNGALPVAAGSDVSVHWNPDGSGAILSYGSGVILYAPAEGNALYRVEALLGQGARRFHWLPAR